MITLILTWKKAGCISNIWKSEEVNLYFQSIECIHLLEKKITK